ncbi:hypothetical protein Kisp01_70140 [Kineosporia sp. NBRC 101677]|nr:hypothetical protein Kisp01_70140 [Kineosporia sp. NBRC 101677]
MVPALPDWNDSQRYIEASVRVARSPHLQCVLRATFSHVLVDEYQDCTRSHHELILALQAAVDACGVLGDPMQAIFGFADPLVEWHEVQEAFPSFTQQCQPWRWRGHNEDLGTWLLDLRSRLVPGATLDLARERLPRGVTLIPDVKPWTLKNTALSTGSADESVLVLTGIAPAMVRTAAAKLGGLFSAMEEIQGSFMREALSDLAARDPAQFAHWLAVTAKKCFEGYGALDTGVLTALNGGRTVSHLKREAITSSLYVLDEVQQERTLESLARAMQALADLRDARLHSHEAWYDIRSALLESLAPGTRPAPDGPREESDLHDALSRVREVRRHVGRKQRRRVVSRTVLVKGLEYDHVIITDIKQLSDICNLYVALTRARKSLTILGPSTLTLKETPSGPRASTQRRRAS